MTLAILIAAGVLVWLLVIWFACGLCGLNTASEQRADRSRDGGSW